MFMAMASSGKKLVAVLQLTANQCKAANFKICESLITDAKKRGAEMVFLPEGFDYIAESSQESAAMSEPLEGTTMTSYRDLAKRLGVWLSLGGFHLKNNCDSRMHNCHVVLNSAGDVVATYAKTHLFDVNIPGKVSLSESRYCIPGTKVAPPVEAPVGKVGLMCCYDLRFPELSGLLAQKGAEILTYPSAFTKVTGEAHWEILLRARAIENQCYVVAAAQAGQHNARRQSYGHSMIVDPWGAILAQCDETPGIALAEIDLERLRDIRRNMPTQSHRRDDLYHLRTAPEVLDESTIEKHDFGGHLISKKEVFFETTLSLAFVNLKPVVPGREFSRQGLTMVICIVQSYLRNVTIAFSATEQRSCTRLLAMHCAARSADRRPVVF
ncbi:hypothetical protein RvY_13968-2 [Ramazzottius varieornatus]|uniref:CN hydrolase domain-containing protein n=1 Tax=Ramazzottius varieornatus TaxID=947166 RepID=A0A1D1VPT6_RAMVA|nr:hypothetical protein RvY_13968-2 [Ramazzottius varieornatus]